MNLIEEFVKVTSTITDAPEIFLEASAYYLISTVCGFKVSCELTPSRGGTPPNEWFIISGQPAITRRSTIISIVSKLFTNVYKNVLRGGSLDFVMSEDDESTKSLSETVADLIIETATPEGLMDHITTNKYPMTMISPEYGGVINQVRTRDYMSGYLTLMSKLYYGEPHSMKLSKRGKQKIERREIPRGVYMTALLGMQEPSLYFDSMFLKQGFLRRILIVHSNPEEKVRFNPYLNLGREFQFSALDTFEENLTKHALSFHHGSPIATDSNSNINNKINDFQTKIEKEFIKEQTMANLYKQSMGEHLLKLTTIHAMACREPVYRERGWWLDLKESDYDSAITFLKKILKRSESVVSSISTSFIERSFLSSSGILEMVMSKISDKGSSGISSEALMIQTGQLHDALLKMVITLSKSKRVVANIKNGTVYLYAKRYELEVENTISTDAILMSW